MSTKAMKARRELKIQKCANGYVVFTEVEIHGAMRDYNDIHVFTTADHLADFVRNWFTPFEIFPPSIPKEI